MSAYSASVPVTASTTAPHATNAAQGLSIANWIAYVGMMARRMSGKRAISMPPSTAKVMNHIAMIGPNHAPIRAVPTRWMAKSPASITMLIGTTKVCSAGAMTSRPSTAPSTVMAGVIMPSP
jgi:hypothetical protein